MTLNYKFCLNDSFQIKITPIQSNFELCVGVFLQRKAFLQQILKSVPISTCTNHVFEKLFLSEYFMINILRVVCRKMHFQLDFKEQSNLFYLNGKIYWFTKVRPEIYSSWRYGEIKIIIKWLNDRMSRMVRKIQPTNTIRFSVIQFCDMFLE